MRWPWGQKVSGYRMDDRRGSACRQDWRFLRFFLITWRSDTFAYWIAAALASPVERPAGRPAWANAIGAAPRCTALRRVAGTHLIGYAVPAAETAGYKTADKEWMWEREREREVSDGSGSGRRHRVRQQAQDDGAVDGRRVQNEDPVSLYK